MAHSRVHSLIRIMALAFVAALAVACGDNDGTPTPTATSTPSATTPPTQPESTPTAPATVPADTCPMVSSACTHARQIADWLRAGDFASVVAATQTRSHTCPAGRPFGAGGPYPLCDGAAAGTVLTGVSIARRYSEGSTVSVDAYRASLEGFLANANAAASDSAGTGAFRFVGVSCVDVHQPPMQCTRSIAIFSAIPRATDKVRETRELLLFFLDTTSPASGVRIETAWTGIVQPPEVATIFQTGGTLFDLGRIFVLP